MHRHGQSEIKKIESVKGEQKEPNLGARPLTINYFFPHNGDMLLRKSTLLLKAPTAASTSSTVLSMPKEKMSVPCVEA
jgi:hypothetical protein